MLSVLVTFFPHRLDVHLDARGQKDLFPNTASFISRCHKIANEARGLSFLGKELSIYDAATSYLLAVSGDSALRQPKSKLYLDECLSILRNLGIQKGANSTIGFAANFPGAQYVGLSEPPETLIAQQMGRRIFWLCWANGRSLQQATFGNTEASAFPEILSAPLPPLPLEIDDIYISADYIALQPAGIVSEIVGFNAKIRLHRSYEALVLNDLILGNGGRIDLAYQRQLAGQALASCKHIIDGLPVELQLRPHIDTSESDSDIHLDDAVLDLNARAVNEMSPETKRKIQYEVQKADIIISQLGTRLHIITKYCESSETNMEIDRILRDLSMMLKYICRLNLEPNGASLIPKLNRIITTLLSRQGFTSTFQIDDPMAFRDVLAAMQHGETVTGNNTEC
ncbi:hypothetical protein MMC10_008236 [Thelotrema lepadinum]|nr:hypothetical protein [Thelotrema lepadinum]